jgi:hypothetical protein
VKQQKQPVPPPPPLPRTLRLAWGLLLGASAMYLPGMLLMLWNLDEVRAHVARDLATDPSTKNIDGGLLASWADAAPFGLLGVAGVMLLVQLACIAIQKTTGSGSSRFALVIIALITLPILFLVYDWTALGEGTSFGFHRLAPFVHIGLLAVGSVFMFMKPSDHWLRAQAAYRASL